jgi:hypothetical protein
MFGRIANISSDVPLTNIITPSKIYLVSFYCETISAL